MIYDKTNVQNYTILWNLTVSETLARVILLNCVINPTISGVDEDFTICSTKVTDEKQG